MSSGPADEAQAGTGRDETPYRRFWGRHDALYWVAGFGFLLNLVMLTRLGGNDRAEATQRLEIGESQYVLYFHRVARSYSTVKKDGRRVFDSRDHAVSICLRLHVSAKGRVEAECHGEHRGATERIVLP